jgi:hypothetical protein
VIYDVSAFAGRAEALEVLRGWLSGKRHQLHMRVRLPSIHINVADAPRFLYEFADLQRRTTLLQSRAAPVAITLSASVVMMARHSITTAPIL